MAAVNMAGAVYRQNSLDYASDFRVVSPVVFALYLGPGLIVIGLYISALTLKGRMFDPTHDKDEWEVDTFLQNLHQRRFEDEHERCEHEMKSLENGNGVNGGVHGSVQRSVDCGPKPMAVWEGQDGSPLTLLTNGDAAVCAMCGSAFSADRPPTDTHPFVCRTQCFAYA
mmetsp:Transcript_36045/g.77885  ORF Transcript_36045/g.77885 Transcript_36045/m.77885 type:complete len:169 (-) Transcript_36045:107-613(-)